MLKHQSLQSRHAQLKAQRKTLNTRCGSTERVSQYNIGDVNILLHAFREDLDRQLPLPLPVGIKYVPALKQYAGQHLTNLVSFLAADMLALTIPGAAVGPSATGEDDDTAHDPHVAAALANGTVVLPMDDAQHKQVRKWWCGTALHSLCHTQLPSLSFKCCWGFLRKRSACVLPTGTANVMFSIHQRYVVSGYMMLLLGWYGPTYP